MGPLLVGLAILAGLPATPADAVDDPKLARMVDPGDDPKTDGGRPRPPSLPVVRFKLSYRYLWTNGLGEGARSDYHVAELDFYPISSLVRVGISAEIGIGVDAYQSWFFLTGLSLGVQYRARVTPFLDGRIAAGIIGGTARGASLVSWMVVGGLEGGVEIHVAGRFLVSAAIGWAHPVYSAIDLKTLVPGMDPPRKQFDNDTVTVKVGFGL